MGLLKTVGRFAYNTSRRSMLTSLRWGHYAPALQMLAGISSATILQEKARPLETIASVNSFRGIARRILTLTQELGLSQESIEVFLSDKGTIPTSVSRIPGGHLLILDKALRNETDQAKIAVIGHELVHIKDNYQLKSLCIALVVPLILEITSSIFCPKYKVSTEYSLLMNAGLALCPVIASYLAVGIFGRHFEKHADVLAAEKSGCAAGLISFLEKYKQSKSGPLSILYKLGHFLDPHPSIEERIKYLTPIAQAQATKQKLAKDSH